MSAKLELFAVPGFPLVNADVDLAASPNSFPCPALPETPTFLKGRSRFGPTLREAILMHAVARLVLHPLVGVPIRFGAR